MAEFPATLWADSTPGAWALLALALYGLVNVLLDGASVLRRMRRARHDMALSMLVLIHNQEHQIEGLIRALATRGWPALQPGDRWELLLVDLQSTDDTPVILQRLARQYQHIRLVTLPRDQACTAGEAALFLCRSPVALLVDLRHQVDSERIARVLYGW